MRINVGCGMTPTPGWLNVDNSMSLRLARSMVPISLLRGFGLIGGEQADYIRFCRENEIVWADATRRLPVPDASAEVIYSCHMLEHLDRSRARAFLDVARRTLCPNGILRIAVPDLERLAAAYMEDGDADAFVDHTLLAANAVHGAKRRLRTIISGPRHHLWMYDSASLKKLLEASGFRDVSVLAAGETTIDNPGELNLAERADESIYAEARR